MFEKDAVPGGLLTYGIPEMKLPKCVVARRIALLTQEGITFRPSCCVGTDISAQELAEQYDLVIFCCGAQQPRPLPCAEQAPQGVYYALDYLRASAEGLLSAEAPKISAAGKHVVVIGAGDSAVRLRRSRAPAGLRVADTAHPEAALGKNGKARSCARGGAGGPWRRDPAL